MTTPRDWLPPPPWEGPPIPRRFVSKPELALPGSALPGLEKPGCIAADNTIVALGHLDGLRRGLGGFGVLRISKERLEEAAAASEQLGEGQLAQAMRSVAAQMSDVRTQEAAGRLADQLRPLADQAWHLGRRCKGIMTPEDMAKARELVRQGKKEKANG